MESARWSIRLNYALLTVNALLLIAGVVLLLQGEISWWLFTVPLLSMASPILNLVNAKRIGQGKKPF